MLPAAPTSEASTEPATDPVPAEVAIEDDSRDIAPGDKILLIIEDDASYAQVLLDMARAKGFKGIVAQRGATALALARDLKPAAVTLDLHLPDVDGWRVLDRLKVDLATRHIPVHIITVDDDQEPLVTQGALAYLKKSDQRDGLEKAFEDLKGFIDRGVRNLLVVEDDETQRTHIADLI